MPKVTQYRGSPDPEPRDAEDRDFIRTDVAPPPKPKRTDFDRSEDEAVRAVAARLGSPEAARRFLSARAQAGALATIATHYIIDRPGYLDSLDEHELGDEFWSRCDWAAGDWHVGDSEAKDGRHVTFKACGIRFRGAEIDAVLAGLPSPAEKNKGGRKPGFKWEVMQKWAEDDPTRTAYSLAPEIAVRYEREIGTPAPKVDTLKKMIKSWRKKRMN